MAWHGLEQKPCEAPGQLWQEIKGRSRTFLRSPMAFPLWCPHRGLGCGSWICLALMGGFGNSKLDPKGLPMPGHLGLLARWGHPVSTYLAQAV